MCNVPGVGTSKVYGSVPVTTRRAASGATDSPTNGRCAGSAGAAGDAVPVAAAVIASRMER